MSVGTPALKDYIPAHEVASHRDSRAALVRAGRRAGGFVVLAIACYELFAATSGALPGVITTFMLAAQPSQATEPVVYWTGHRPGWTELAGGVAVGVVFAIGFILAAGPDARLYRPQLLARERDLRTAIALLAAGGLVAIDLVLRVRSIDSPGHPLAFRVMSAVAAVGVLMHAGIRLWRVAGEQASAFLPLVTTGVSVLAAGTVAGILAGELGVQRAFPLDAGQLKHFQLYTDVAVALGVGWYVLAVTLSPGGVFATAAWVDEDSPAEDTSPDDRRERVRVFIGPGEEPLTVIPKASADVGPVTGGIHPQFTSRLFVYRATRDGRGEKCSPHNLDLVRHEYWILDAELLPKFLCGEYSLDITPAGTAKGTASIEWGAGTVRWKVDKTPQVDSLCPVTKALLTNRAAIQNRSEAYTGLIRATVNRLFGALSETTPSEVAELLTQAAQRCHRRVSPQNLDWVTGPRGLGFGQPDARAWALGFLQAEAARRAVKQFDKVYIPLTRQIGALRKELSGGLPTLASLAPTDLPTGFQFRVSLVVGNELRLVSETARVIAAGTEVYAIYDKQMQAAWEEAKGINVRLLDDHLTQLRDERLSRQVLEKTVAAGLLRREDLDLLPPDVTLADLIRLLLPHRRLDDTNTADPLGSRVDDPTLDEPPYGHTEGVDQDLFQRLRRTRVKHPRGERGAREGE